MSLTINGLKKVGLFISFPKQDHNTDESGLSANFEFIHGIGPTGLTSFELSMADKGEGDGFDLNIPAAQAPEFFGHNYTPILNLLALQVMPDNLLLEVLVVTVQECDGHEVVKSIVKAGSGCGCGGSCGCG